MLTLAVMIGILVNIPLGASAATGISYVFRSWDSSNQRVVDSTKTCTSYSVIGSQKDLTIGNGEPVWDWDDDYIGAIVTRTCVYGHQQVA